MTEEDRGTVSFEHAEEREAIVSMCEDMAKLSALDASSERLAQFGAFSAKLIPRLITALDAAERKTHGGLGDEMREAVRDHFLAKFEGRTLLAHKVEVKRVGLWFGEDGVAVADIRLELRR